MQLASTLAQSALGYPVLERAGYRLRLAADDADLESVQKLRFEVFNLELGEGFEESYASGLDQDQYDEYCEHLVVEHMKTGLVVGTYRLQSKAMAEAGAGFYTAEEYDFTPLTPLLDQAAEASRACVHVEHREGGAIQLLWKGVAQFMVTMGARYLVGLTSLTSQDPDEGIRGWVHLREGEFLHPELRLRPLGEFECATPEELDGSTLEPLAKMPTLFDAYLRLGTKIIGFPAIDREFGTIDYLALLDFANLSPLVHRRFMPR